MPLLRGFARIEKGGRVPIPSNIRREAGLEEGQLVEIKLQGPMLAQYITVKSRKQPR